MEQLQEFGNANQSTQKTSSEKTTQKNELWGEGPMRINVTMDGKAAVTLGPFRISDIYHDEETLKKCVDYETVRMMINIAIALNATQKAVEDDQKTRTKNIEQLKNDTIPTATGDELYYEDQKQRQRTQTIKDQLSDYNH